MTQKKVSIFMGGTGANSAAEARDALGVLATSGGTVTGVLNVANTLLVSGNVAFGTNTPYTAAGHTYLTIDNAINGGGFVLQRNSSPAFLATVDATSVYLDSPTSLPIRFFIGVNEAARIDSNGNVGIGVTSPETKLDINGVVRFRNGTLTGSGFVEMASVSGVGLTMQSFSYVFKNSTNTAEFLRITSAGNVGIGTTTPSHILDIIGNSGSNTWTRILGGTGSTSGGIIVGNNDTDKEYGRLFWDNASNDLILSHEYVSGALTFRTNLIERMRISSNGRIGFGTTSPTNQFHFSGGTGDGRIALTNDARGNGNADGLWVGVDSTQSYILSRGNYPLTFYTNATSKMVVTSAGDVGIGTTAPSYRLSVVDSIGIKHASTTQVQAVKGTYWGYSSSYPVVMLGSGSGGPTVSIGYDPINNGNGAFTGDGREILFRRGARFVTPNSSDNAFYLRNLVLLDGNVGIGTDSPSQSLSVQGNVSVSGVVTQSAVPAFFARSLSNPATSGYVTTIPSELVFNTVTYNNGNHYNNSTGRFTAPVSGYYWMFVSFLVDDNVVAGEVTNVQAMINGSIITGFVPYAYQQGTGTYYLSMAGGMTVQLNAGDYFSIRGNSGKIHTGSETHFSGFLIG